MFNKSLVKTISSLLLIASFSGCKTTQILQPGQQVKEIFTRPAGELRGYAVLPGSWINNEADIMRKNISGVMQKLADANYNAVFFFAEERFDQLAVATEEAHRQNLKIYAVLDLPEPADNTELQSLPLLKTYMKNKVCSLVSKYNIDGLSLRLSGHFSDLMEDIAVEAMLIKPYLINSIIFSGEEEHQIAARCLAEGIVDIIVPGTDIGIMGPESILNRYPDKISIPGDLKKTGPEKVVGLDLSELFPGNPGGQTIYLNDKSKTKVTDSQGCIGFITSNPDTIKIRTSDGNIILPTGSWNLPYKYSVQPDYKAIRKSPWVEFRSMPKKYPDLPEYDFLCKTEYPATVRINDVSLKQYRTGIFFNKVTFNEGQNRVRATVLTKDSISVFYEQEFIYEKNDKTRKPFPLWINEKSVEPAYDLELLSEDIVRISFQGSLGQEAVAEVMPGKIKIKCSRQDYKDYSLYMAALPLRKLTGGKSYKIVLKLIPAPNSTDNKTFVLTLQNSIRVMREDDFPLVKTVRENARLTYNLGEPRLGGPIRSELGKGVVMKTNGLLGDNYRIRLSRVENGIINKNDVEKLPLETVQTSYFIEDMSCGPGADADVLSIPYLSPIPYEVYPDPDQNRIVITLFGAETASTWITHRTGRKIIDKVTWKQTTPETYQVFVNLKTSKIWGYDIRPEGKRLVLRIKYPPEYDIKNEKPLTGLKIAIEAGHGGLSTGAIGLSGLVEKDINLDLSLRLGELCKSMGAEIIQIRDSDKDMSLIEKRSMPIASDADLLVCIHANAGGKGYLSVSGTSTYYNNPFWAPMAESIYNRLLELGLAEFGVVGSFNYTVIRVSQLPGILVEQAFMTHAEDEEKLADPQFRQQEAQKIYEGIIDYLKYLKQ
jgi:N-acetylmuramoyl-L-alanine amidase